MELGQEIIRELKLDRRDAILERWLCHYLAELMDEADKSTGTMKEVAEQKAVDIILKLWNHRRALPENVDPLGGYRNAIKVLGRLMPDADPWRKFRELDATEKLLNEMFGTLSRIVLGGILVTQLNHFRGITSIEAKTLDEKEIYLQKTLEEWLNFFDRSTEKTILNLRVVNLESMYSSSEPQSENVNSTIHSSIIANLERMQTDLAALLARWKTVEIVEPEYDDEPSADNEDGDED